MKINEGGKGKEGKRGRKGREEKRGGGRGSVQEGKESYMIVDGRPRAVYVAQAVVNYGTPLCTYPLWLWCFSQEALLRVLVPHCVRTHCGCGASVRKHCSGSWAKCSGNNS